MNPLAVEWKAVAGQIMHGFDIPRGVGIILVIRNLENL